MASQLGHIPGVCCACSETSNRCGWHKCLDDSFAELVLYDLKDTSASDDENNALLWWKIIYLENKFQGPYIPKHVSDRQSVVVRVWRGDNIIAIIIPCNTNAVHMDTIKNKKTAAVHIIFQENIVGLYCSERLLILIINMETYTINKKVKCQTATDRIWEIFFGSCQNRKFNAWKHWSCAAESFQSLSIYRY